MKKIAMSGSIYSMWRRLPLVVRAVLSGLFVSGVGVFTWGNMVSRLPFAWVVLPGLFVLWAFWKFFSGSWGTGCLAETRKAWFRSTHLSPSGWKWGIAAAIFFVVIIQSSFVVTFRLIEFPAVKFTADYKLFDTFPRWVAWLLLVMCSVVNAVCEEAGFRGYMQFPIEKRYGPVIAIVVASILFALIHLTHTWALPIVPHIFFASVLLGIMAWKSGSLIPGIIGHAILDIFDYSVWWTNLTGGFKHPTIFKTGVDVHFIVWVLIFSFGIFAFFRVIGRLHRSDVPQVLVQENGMQLIH